MLLRVPQLRLRATGHWAAVRLAGLGVDPLVAFHAQRHVLLLVLDTALAIVAQLRAVGERRLLFAQLLEPLSVVRGLRACSGRRAARGVGGRRGRRRRWWRLYRAAAA